MKFFYYASKYKTKKKNIFFGRGGGVEGGLGGGGARVKGVFFTKNPNLKKNFFFFGWRRVSGWGG